MNRVCCVLICFLISFGPFGNALNPNQLDEQNISTAIFTGYSKNVRPSQEVLVSVYLSFIQINSVEEKTQTMTTNSYLTMTWTDSRLSWSPATYDGLTDIMVPGNPIVPS